MTLDMIDSRDGDESEAESTGRKTSQFCEPEVKSLIPPGPSLIATRERLGRGRVVLRASWSR